MSKKDKLIIRLKSKPKDFTFDEMESLLFSLGFAKVKAGKTGGSRVGYFYNGIVIRIHKPHPGNWLKPYQIIDIITNLRKADLI